MLEGATYKWVKERIRLSADAAEQIYSLPTVRHFYDEQSIEEWKRHWTRP
jgi:hypothetical protein